MYLRRIELQGFKSFPRKTSLEFGSGISAVVGPNGAGKSNIADAIRWALGEQSFRQLRGQRTEDVIFSGSPNRPRAGMAQVTLVFDNSDSWLPLEFAEVSVTRRGHRSGENEYLINNSLVRLRDVQDLLRTGALGVNGQVVIGQGQVDSALSLRPEDRRVLLEEAAGVSRHYAKRDEAQHKLEGTERNLERLRDLHAELGPRLEQLGLQAELAERSGEIRGELKEAVRALLAHRLWQAQAAADAAAGDEREAAAALAKLEALESTLTEASLDAELDETRRRHADAASAVEDLRAKFGDLSAGSRLASQRAEFEGRRIADFETQARLLAAELARFEAPGTEDRQALEQLEARIRSLEAEVQGSDPDPADPNALQRLLQAAVAARRTATGLASEIARLQEAERGLAARDREALADVSNARSDLDKLQDSMGSLQSRSEAAGARLNFSQGQAAAAREARTRAAGDVNAARAALEAANSEAMRRRAAIEGMKAEIEAVTAAGAESQAARRGLAGLLEQAGNLHVRGLLRTGLQDIPEELGAPVAAALGHLLDDVILDHAADLPPAVDLLHKAESGSVRLRPAQGFHIPHPRRLFGGGPPQGPGIVGTLDTLLRVNPSFEPVIGPLLASILVVDNLATAVELRSSGGKVEGYHVVTLDGEYLDRDGSVLAGRLAAESAAELTERAAELQFRLENAQATQQDLEQRESQSQAGLTESLAADERAASFQESATIAATEARSLLRAAEEELSLTRRQMTWWQTLVERAETTLAEIGTRREAARGRMAELQPSIAPARQAVEEADAAALRAQRSSGAGAATLQGERERLAHLRDRIAARESELESRRRTGAELGDRVAEAARLRDEAAAEARRLEGESAACRAALQQGIQELEQTRAKLAGLELNRERGSIAARLREVELDKLHNAVRSAHDRFESAQQRGADLRGRALEELGPSDLTPARFAGSIGDLDARIERLRRLVNEIGPVNPLAPKQFEDESQRRRQLDEQIDDLDRSSAELRRIARDLETAVRGEFMATFETIRKGFDAYFQILMGGGKASMSLTDPDHPATTGIEIEVQIPGKRRQPLNALSGGERSLVAAALLFALINARPGPLCVLDEVDAALDDENIVRFRRLVAEFAGRTQFIVITHNPGTIEQANTIFGVSMAADGISQVISLRLNGADQPAAQRRAEVAAGP